jgi:dCTP deaminase
MILSNTEILNGISKGLFDIHPLAGNDLTLPPFNTSAVDLRLASEILVPTNEGTPIQIDSRQPGIAPFLAKHSKSFTATEEQPFILRKNQLILAKTVEQVNFPISTVTSYSARVEGKSSLARCGILVHFTAPTIHAGFSGTITLEIINFGPWDFALTPNMYICQLIIEEVSGCPINTPNQFAGQNTAAGLRS